MSVPAVARIGGGVREAVIDLDAIRANVRTMRDVIGQAEVIAVVKADGYGHGAIPVARAAVAAGATRLGVADLDEAHALRESGIDAPILAWLHAPATDFAAGIVDDVEIGVSTLEQLDAVSDAAHTTRRCPRVHLKLDTGLHRNGLPEPDWAEAFERARRAERAGRLRVDGVFSHLANSSPDDDHAQLAAFDAGLRLAASAGLTPTLRHLASTAGALRLPATRFDAVRLGIGLYGLSPFGDGTTSAALGLRPAMTLTSTVANVRRADAGAGASYGYTWRAPVPTTVALVPLGYGDGIPRQASNRGSVTIGHRRCDVVGRIAMDQFIVETGAIVETGTNVETGGTGDPRAEPVAIGDTVTVFGDPSRGVPSADDWAEAAGTINYDIVTRIGARVQRRYIGADAATAVSATTSAAASPGTSTTAPDGSPGGRDASGLRVRDRASARTDVATAADMHRLGVGLAGILGSGDLVVLTGPLGAGKTTLARGVGEGLGVRGAVTSPTFVLARTHPRMDGGAPLVHVDAYRLSSALELDDLDIDFAGSIVLVEWGTGMLEGISESWLDVRIERPRGPTAAGSPPTVRNGEVENDEIANADVDVDTDVDTDANADADADDSDDDLDQPRIVTIAAHGPRWRVGGDESPPGPA